MSSTRITAKNAPTASRSGNARRVRARVEAWIDTATDAIPITSATYTGLGASSTHAAAASAHTSQTPACHVRSGAVVACADADAGSRQPEVASWSPLRTNVPSRQRSRATRMLRAVPGLSVSGTGEVGARPTLTRNCERLCGSCRTP